jgi:hypothetical protein
MVIALLPNVTRKSLKDCPASLALADIDSSSSSSCSIEDF